MAKIVDAGEALRYSWPLVKQKLGLLLGIEVVIMGIGLVFQFLPRILMGGVSQNVTQGEIFTVMGLGGLVALFTIGGLVIQKLLELGRLHVYLKVLDSKAVSFNDLFSQSAKILTYVLSSMLYGFIIVAGFLLFVIPGIIWSIKYGYFPLLILEKNLGVWESLKESGRITKGHKWDLFIFGFMMMLINLAGLVALGIGLLVTLPWSMLATAYVYRKLLWTADNSGANVAMDGQVQS